MSAFPISQLVIDAVFARLSNDTQGFNATFNGLATGYGITERMAIQFTEPSPNFAMVNVDPEDWSQTSGFKYPLLTLFSKKSINMNWQKFHQFSGDVTIGLNTFIDWKQGRVKVNFESYANCVEETLYTIFNRARNAFPGDQDWGEDIVYNGNFGIVKSRVERAAEFWRQGLFGEAEFTVDQQGVV